jgi:hypothetical protein
MWLCFHMWYMDDAASPPKGDLTQQCFYDLDSLLPCAKNGSLDTSNPILVGHNRSRTMRGIEVQQATTSCIVQGWDRENKHDHI